MFRPTHEPYEPTPDEIERVCAEIRSRWSEQERRARSAGMFDDQEERPRRVLPEIVVPRHTLGRSLGE